MGFSDVTSEYCESRTRPISENLTPRHYGNRMVELGSKSTIIFYSKLLRSVAVVGDLRTRAHFYLIFILYVDNPLFFAYCPNVGSVRSVKRPAALEPYTNFAFLARILDLFYSGE